MKIRNLLYIIGAALIMSSCTTTSFYQVYEVRPIEESNTKTAELLFEDDNCKIAYDLWANGGNIGFNFYNKTDSKIYVKLNESNFILNGFAYDYFKNRTFTTSESKSASALRQSTGSVSVAGVNSYYDIQTNQIKSSSSASLGSSVGYAVSIKEDSIICIPPKTTKRISEYLINNTLIRNCDLFKYPRTKEIKTKTYTAEKSPIVFSNRITYNINGSSKLVENDFFVSEITNYPDYEFFEYKYDQYCGQIEEYSTKYYKFYDIDKFYIRYNKETDYFKH
jgi:hypothetical protein